MREMTIEIGGRERTLAATFGASIQLADRVADPLMIAREAAVEAQMAHRGLTYDPKWKPTVSNVPAIIHIGLAAAGDDAKIEDVREWVFDIGFVEASAMAIDYVGLIVTPQPASLPEGEGEPGK